MSAEGLLAQLLDDEDMLADPHLVLHARAQNVFVVRRPSRQFCASSGLDRNRSDSRRTTRSPAPKPSGTVGVFRLAPNSFAFTCALPSAVTPMIFTSPINSETNLVCGAE